MKFAKVLRFSRKSYVGCGFQKPYLSLFMWVGISWALLCSPVLSWALLGSLGLSWAHLGSPVLSWALLSSLELSRGLLASPGALLGSLELSRGLLGSPGALLGSPGIPGLSLPSKTTLRIHPSHVFAGRALVYAMLKLPGCTVVPQDVSQIM